MNERSHRESRSLTPVSRRYVRCTVPQREVGATSHAESRFGMRKVAIATIVAAAVVAAGVNAVNAQSTPPVQGTVALESAMKSFYKGLNTIIVTTMDGVEHTYHFTERLIVHGGKSPGPDALAGLQEGRMVVIHYTVEGSNQTAREIDILGDEGLKVTEGRVTKIDRGRKEITIRFGNGQTETLRLTDQAAAEAAKDLEGTGGEAARVIVYYEDENGRKVAHYFRRAG